MNEPHFQQNYKSLNLQQKLAVDTIEGPVMVIAGPGTGKTQILTMRIANIINSTDTSAANILALTFTEAAAKQMRQRLAGLIGQLAYQVQIHTFHSYCSQIINQNQERFSRKVESQPVSDLEKLNLVTTILESNNFISLKPLNSPLLYTKDIISALSDLKREGVSPSKFNTMVTQLVADFEDSKDSLKKTAYHDQEKLVTKNVDLLKIYNLYEEGLKNNGLYDFEDMINWVVDEFEKDRDFLLQYQESTNYILVDEYQDTNSSQNRLIFLLSSFWEKNANVFVVGDPDQSIFRFQGASKENIIQFNSQFPEAKIINLIENYRSTDTILKTAASLLNQESLSSNKLHLSSKIYTAKLKSSLLEDHYLVTKIKELLNNETLPNDIAVIVKENKEVEHLSKLFSQHSIPFRFESGTNILTTPHISQVIHILKAIADLKQNKDEQNLFKILNYPYFQLDPLDLLVLTRHASLHKIPLYEALLSKKGQFSDLAIKLSKWSASLFSNNPTQVFLEILNQSGIVNYLIGLNSVVEFNRINLLIEEIERQHQAKNSLTLAEVVENLCFMIQHGIKIEETNLVGDRHGVTITTVHKSKGLEWDIIFLYRFVDAHWGNKSSRQMLKLPPQIIKSNVSQEEKDSDEKRLLYVALTRAKSTIYLIGSENYSHSKKMSFPSMYLYEFDNTLLTSDEITQVNINPSEVLIQKLQIEKENKEEDKVIDTIIKDFRISATSLNTYLECAYKFKLFNLFKIPQQKSLSLSFGTAIHTSLEEFYFSFKKYKKVPDLQTLIRKFKTSLRKEISDEVDFNNRFEHGKNVLEQFYQSYLKHAVEPLYTERKFGYKNEIDLEGLSLVGKIDRIDIVNESGNSVSLIDYKTGSPKTRSFIEGKTQDSNGNYKRQLVFYKLLTQLDPLFKYQAIQSELIFVEPDKLGKFHRELFTITNEEVVDLKKTIYSVAQQIKNHNFARTTNTKTCLRCELLSHCWPNGLPEPDQSEPF